MEIKDLTGLGEPIKRLIEVISEGIGTVFRPSLMRRSADAKAYEIEKISEAIKKVGEQHQLPVSYKDGQVEIWQKPEDKTLVLTETSITQRVEKRLDYQERKRQQNIETITSIAAHQLEHESSVPKDKPDEDWIARFFSNAQDVSSKEMQELWGRILSGEVKQPGSYSLRTLDFVKNLRKSDAEIFEKVGQYALCYQGLWGIFVSDKKWLETRGVY